MTTNAITSPNKLTDLYKNLQLASAKGDQELRGKDNILYLKEGKSRISVERTRYVHQRQAVQSVISAMHQEYGIDPEDAKGLLRSVQSDTALDTVSEPIKVTVSDVRQLHNELTIRAKQKSERSQELNEVGEQRKIAAAVKKQGLDETIRTHEQLHTAIEEHYGQQTLALLKSKLPSFMAATGSLSPAQVDVIAQLLNSDAATCFAQAIQMVHLNPSSGVDDQCARLVATELAKLPLNLLNKANQMGVRVVVTDNNVTTYLPELKGQGARGHGGGTWDNIQGVGAFGIRNETVIAMEKNASGDWQIGTNHGSANLVLHEFGHTIDRLIGAKDSGRYFSKASGFDTGWANDYNQLDTDYFRQDGGSKNTPHDAGLEESFAEGLARLYGGNSSFKHWPSIEAHLMTLS